jgi:hypothetical protein
MKLTLIIGGPIWVAMAAYLIWIFSGDNPPHGALWAGLMSATGAFPLLVARELWREKKKRQGAGQAKP